MDETAEKKVINQLAASLMDARNRSDPKGFTSFYADDAEFTNVKGKTTRGKDALEQSLKAFYATPFVQKTRQVIEGTSVKFVHPRVASLDIRWRTEGATDLTGQPRRGIVNAILVKDSSEKWEVKVSHNTELIEGETSTLGEALDREKVQRMADMFSTDFKNGDYSHMASFFAEKAIYMPAGRETIKGREDIERYWRAAHEEGVKDFKINVERVENAGNMAYEIGSATAFIRRPSDGQETTDSVRYLVVWGRDPEGVWRILADVSN